MADTISGISSNASTYVSNKDTSKSNDLDKEAFLKLLVAQMQYQDPLNPGDSTEYMSQLAQYSSLEATMNINKSIEQGNFLNLVGQYVIMNTTDAAGNKEMISGLVEYATVKDGEVLLSINDKYYSAEDLDSVVDYDYYLFLRDQANKAENDAGEVEDNSEANDSETENGQVDNSETDL